MKWCYFCFVLLLVGACTLSSKQEATLHQALTSYVNAHNEGFVKSYVGYTHPNVVGYYEDQGDSIFRQKFELFSPENGGDFLQDGTVKEIEIKGEQLHVHYVFDRFNEPNLDSSVDKINIIAISVDDGESWFFVEESDYKNDKIFSKDERLIDL
jgi:hypothetical protein